MTASDKALSFPQNPPLLLCGKLPWQLHADSEQTSPGAQDPQRQREEFNNGQITPHNRQHWGESEKIT